MAAPKKGGLALAIFGKGASKEDAANEPPASEEMEMGGESTLDEELGAVADDLLTAIEGKDRMGIVEALKSAHDICAAHDDDYDDKP